MYRLPFEMNSFLYSRYFILNNPVVCNPNRIIITPPTILNILWFLSTRLLIELAEAPSEINIIENPNENKSTSIKIFPVFFLSESAHVSLSIDIPVMKEI